MDGALTLDTGMALSNTHTGCRTSLWLNGSDWYDFGMNSSQLIYNVPQILQVNNSAAASINASGLYIGYNLLS